MPQHKKINGKLELFGAYEIDEKALKEAMGKDAEFTSINDSIEKYKTDNNVSYEEAAAAVRNNLIKEYGKTNDTDKEGTLENFLEKFGNVNLETAQDIDFYDENGNIKFKNEDGTPVTIKNVRNLCKNGLS